VKCSPRSFTPRAKIQSVSCLVNALGHPAAVYSSIVVPKILELVQKIAAIEDISRDVPLMQAGLTSANAIQTRNALSDLFPDVSLPSMLVFDYPTLRKLSTAIQS
jgi:hypothetical protein